MIKQDKGDFTMEGLNTVIEAEILTMFGNFHNLLGDDLFFKLVEGTYNGNYDIDTYYLLHNKLKETSEDK